jgi:hypothetical protein
LRAARGQLAWQKKIPQFREKMRVLAMRSRGKEALRILTPSGRRSGFGK